MGSGSIPTPIENWEGMNNFNGVLPPDTNGDVGPNHYVQMVNLSFAVYSKTGTLLYGPFNNNTLWAGFGGPCQNDNSGDPVVVYDPLADRWILSQFAVSTGSHVCFAVSQTGDPTGAYYRYAFNIGGFPDYPKIAVWPEAYLATFRNFGAVFDMQAAAFNRAKMLAGDPSAEMYIESISDAMPVPVDGYLPVDLDGTSTPAGAPAMFVGYVDGLANPDDDYMVMFEMDVDWANLGNSTFDGPFYMQAAPFDSDLCGGSRDCIPQPDTAQGVDSLNKATMHRGAYRDYGFYQSIALNHSVDVDGTDHAGVRWYELRNSGAGWGIYQQGTYAPDSDHRWMGSVALDQVGNLAAGYSVSSDTVYPSIRYAGRLVTDPLGDLAQGEGSIIVGIGSQTHPAGRWGDYSAMAVDPVDECTFYYTTEYIETTGSAPWQTRIASFKFDECPDPGTDDFAVWGQPDRQAVCEPDNADFNVTLFEIGDLNQNVTLSAMGVPPGYTAGFSANPVMPPDTVVMSINNTGASVEGSYDIEIEGAAAVGTRSDTVTLDVTTDVPGSITLVSPPDGAATQPIQPMLQWDAVFAGTQYDVEVATDAGFTNIVDSATVGGTSYQVQVALELGPTYYWRVRGYNSCGQGAWSDVWSFTTLSASCPANTTTVSVYLEEFEAGAPGWTHYALTAPDTWAFDNTRPSPGSGGLAYQADDVDGPSDQALESPDVLLPTDYTQLTMQFYNEQDFEDPAGSGGCWDGGILEISTDGGGSWTQLDSELLTDPYDGVGNNGPPTGFRMWCGTTNGFQPWLNSIVDIGAFGGENVRFRWRLLTDAAAGAPGWWIDDMEVVACTDEVTDVSLTGIEAAPATNLWPLALLAGIISLLMLVIYRRVRSEI